MKNELLNKFVDTNSTELCQAWIQGRNVVLAALEIL